MNKEQAFEYYPWLPDQIAAYEGGESLREIGTEVGLTGSRVHQIFQIAGVEMRPVGGAVEENKQAEVICDYESGRKVGEIAEKFGISEPTVFRILHRKAVPLRKTQPAYNQHKGWIVTKYKEGWSTSEIAEALNCHPNRVRYVLRTRGIKIHRQMRMGRLNPPE